MSTEQILAIQDAALLAGDRATVSLTWRALGYDNRVAFMPVTTGEQREAVAKLAART